jgi:hypothetical protein
MGIQFSFRLFAQLQEPFGSGEAIVTLRLVELRPELVIGQITTSAKKVKLLGDLARLFSGRTWRLRPFRGYPDYSLMTCFITLGSGFAEDILRAMHGCVIRPRHGASASGFCQETCPDVLRQLEYFRG